MAMEQQQNREAWELSKRQLKERHPELNEQDLNYDMERAEQMLEHLQAKLGKTKEEIRNWLHLMG